MTLYINCCVRGESRTDRLARAVLGKMGEYTELYLPGEDIRPLSEEALRKRTALLGEGKLDDPMFRYAHQFAEADKIVISAPFWDGSFPSLLKVYIENIYAVGIVSRYSADGKPVGMCRADDFSYDYIKAIAESCFGIGETSLIKAEMLDIEGMDAEKILNDAIGSI